jgi:outer membrane protein, heavy metal efflux system
MNHHLRWACLIFAVSVVSAPGLVPAQEIPSEPGAAAGAVPSTTRLGPTPGAGGGAMGNQPGTADATIGGRPGPSVPRVPSSITRPGPGFGAPAPRGITLPPALPITEAPLYGTLAIPTGGEEEGPPDGLTLDQAIERLIRENISLRSRFLEIPKAQADILTASLRANPLFYADAQQVPYGNFSERRPGGPTQYDVSLTHPLDVNGKRRARTVVAGRARRVLEAQYQDAVRIEIDNLYTAFVDVLAARETLRYARTSAAGLRDVVAKTRTLLKNETITEADYYQVANQLEAAEVGVMDAEEAYRDAKRTLGGLLNIPPEQAEALEMRGTIRDLVPPPPPAEALTGMALVARPDLVAFRLGIALAEANVRLAEANRFSDLYLLYQPYTFQNNAPFDAKSAHAWAVGLTVPLPLYNRNQGNIQRARITVTQVKLDLTDRERQAAIEVRKAAREYAVSRATVERVERGLLPSARRVLDTILVQFTEGEVDALAYLNAQRSYNDIVRQYRDTVVRHRRSMLRLNTVIGRRLLP